MRLVKVKIILFFCMGLLVGCTSNDTVLPTLVPTAGIRATATPSLSLPATNTPLSSAPDATADEAGEAEAVIEALDLETCQEALTAQSELESLQEQGQDVAELATAVAELIEELENCEAVLTPTPFNE